MRFEQKIVPTAAIIHQAIGNRAYQHGAPGFHSGPYPGFVSEKLASNSLELVKFSPTDSNFCGRALPAKIDAIWPKNPRFDRTPKRCCGSLHNFARFDNATSACACLHHCKVAIPFRLSFF